MRRLLAVAGSATAVLTIMATATPATALPAGDYSSALKKELTAASLRVADLPTSFSKKPKRSVSYSKAPHTDPFEMCVDKNGEKVFGAAARQHLNSSISLSQSGTGDNVSASVAVSSDTYVYPSVRSASKRWRALKKGTRQCAPRINKPIDVSGASIKAIVHQRTKSTRPSTGGRGFTISQRVIVDVSSGAGSGISIYVGGYSAYRHVGKSIVRVQFANYNQASAASSKIKPKWAKFTRKEAVTIVRRMADL